MEHNTSRYSFFFLFFNLQTYICIFEKWKSKLMWSNVNVNIY